MNRIALITLLAVLPLCACAPGKLPGTKVGKPYNVGGKTYYPAHDIAYDKTGEASWYGPGFHGNSTASGETYNQNDLTAAHPTLPMPSLVRVTNLSNGKNAVIRVNDRGPFAANRIIDLSKKSAQALGINGVAHVRVQYLEEETQQYLAMVKANEGRIIAMADYNKRAAEIKMAQMAAAAAPSADAAADIPSPMKSIRSIFVKEAMADDLVERQAPLYVEETDLPPVVVQPLQTPSETMPAETAPVLVEYPPVQEPAPVKGAYAIQLGSFASEENARKLARKLSGIAEPAVEQVDIKGRSWWRVRIDGIKDRYSADMMAEKVRAAGVPEARVVRP